MGDPTYDNAADLDAEGIPTLHDTTSDDEGLMAHRDHPRAESHWGTTANEERRRESVALRETQLQPEVSEDDIDEADADPDALLGELSSGMQLTAPGDEDVDAIDEEPALVGMEHDAEGLAPAPEEAAMHVIPEDELA